MMIMGQSEIMYLLKSNPLVWLTSDEISILTGMNVDSVNRCLRMMRYHKEVNFRKSTRKYTNGGGRMRYEYQWRDY